MPTPKQVKSDIAAFLNADDKAAARTALEAAPALGADDNYVTDAEKAALHSHDNAEALAAVSGTNTGNEDTASILAKIGDGELIGAEYMPDAIVAGIGGPDFFPEEGSFIGQLLKDIDNTWYRWDGSAWQADAGATAHKSTHATGGSDALTPADIGAMANTNAAVNAAMALAPGTSRAALVAAKSTWVNVTESPYNADSTGVVDATTAIQAALDQSAVRSIYIPAGTYKLSNHLVFKHSGTTIRGDGKASTILNQTNAAKHVFVWDGFNLASGGLSPYQCDISSLKIVGTGGDAHTGTAIYMRRDNGTFLSGRTTISNVIVENFSTGLWCQSFWKLRVMDTEFNDCATAAKLVKADTFYFGNVSMGAANLSSNTVGYSIERSDGVPAGGNFGGVIMNGEYGDMNRFIHMTGGSVSVVEPNLERVGWGAGQCVAYIQGYSSFRWQGGRIENGPGASPQAFFRVRCSSGSPDPNTIPSISIDGLNQGAGGWRVVEFFGDLNYQGSVSSTTGALPVVYTATEAGTALISTAAGAVPSFGSGSPHAINSTYRGRPFFVPFADAGAGNDSLVIVARDKANQYARRGLINDNLQKVLYSSAALLSSAAGAETALLTYNIPAYAAADIGWEIRIRVVGRFANNTNNKRIRLSLDNPSFYQIYDSGSAAYQDSAFVLEGTYHVRAVSQNALTVTCISDDALVMPKIYAPEGYSPSHDVAKDFKILTTGVAAADVKIHSVRVVAVKGSSEY